MLFIYRAKKIMAQDTLGVRKEMVDALSAAISEKSDAKVKSLLDAKARISEINQLI